MEWILYIVLAVTGIIAIVVLLDRLEEYIGKGDPPLK